MGFDWGRVGLGIATGGLSEVHRATQSGYAASSPGLADAGRRARFAAAIEAAKNRPDPGAEFRTAQTGLVGTLQTAASGQGPSIADPVLKQGSDRAVANAMALAATSRGVNPALAQRMAMQNAAQAEQGVAGQAGMIRVQEAQNAQGLLSGTLQGARSADLEAQRQKDELVKSYEAMGLSADQAELQANLQAQGINAGVAEKNSENTTKMIGGGLQGLGSVLALSDERGKKDIRSGDKQVYRFLDAISAEDYAYKDPANGEGRFVSPMAQDLEKSDMGNSMVEDTPEGKMVRADGHSFGAVLAAQAHLHKRLKEIESKMGKARK